MARHRASEFRNSWMRSSATCRPTSTFTSSWTTTQPTKPGRSVTGSPSAALARALHANLSVMDQSGRTLLRPADRAHLNEACPLGRRARKGDQAYIDATNTDPNRSDGPRPPTTSWPAPTLLPSPLAATQNEADFRWTLDYSFDILCRARAKKSRAIASRAAEICSPGSRVVTRFRSSRSASRM